MDTKAPRNKMLTLASCFVHGTKKDTMSGREKRPINQEHQDFLQSVVNPTPMGSIRLRDITIALEICWYYQKPFFKNYKHKP